MNPARARDHVLDRALEVSPQQFEVLCKMVLARTLDTDALRVTPFHGDGGIDIEGSLDWTLADARFGAQVKQYAASNTVGLNAVQRFDGALSQYACQFGTFVTTGRYTDPARESADEVGIRLVDGEMLSTVMVENRIGVTETPTGGLEVDLEFWKAFDEPEREASIPTVEVPLANSFETLRDVLRAIEATDGSKRAITERVEDITESRHADLYGLAGWLLGFVHKDTPVVVNGREQRRWGLTRTGSEYLALHERGERDRAESVLTDAIADVEVVARARTAVEECGGLDHGELADLLEAETELSESSATRRASTIGQWLTKLPEIRAKRDGRSKRYELDG